MFVSGLFRGFREMVSWGSKAGFVRLAGQRRSGHELGRTHRSARGEKQQ
jgi:hypothetical protein